MNIGIVGLGLIGGSIAKRLAKCGHNLYLTDINRDVLSLAIRENKAKELLDFNSLDLVILALPPSILLNYLEENHKKLEKTLLTDVCGIKERVEILAEKYNLNYFGMHPMAGREVGGYCNSIENLFDNANLVVTNNEIPYQINVIIKDLGFSKVMKTTSVEHDKIIAYTSQLCHIVSNAFGKSPILDKCDGFTGGSFEDLTRVGRLDVKLWLDLFKSNRENITNELDIFINNLIQYKNALESKDDNKLYELLLNGSEILTKNKRM